MTELKKKPLFNPEGAPSRRLGVCGIEIGCARQNAVACGSSLSGIVSAGARVCAAVRSACPLMRREADLRDGRLKVIASDGEGLSDGAFIVHGGNVECIPVARATA